MEHISIDVVCCKYMTSCCHKCDTNPRNICANSFVYFNLKPKIPNSISRMSTYSKIFGYGFGKLPTN